MVIPAETWLVTPAMQPRVELPDTSVSLYTLPSDWQGEAENNVSTLSFYFSPQDSVVLPEFLQVTFHTIICVHVEKE